MRLSVEQVELPASGYRSAIPGTDALAERIGERPGVPRVRITHVEGPSPKVEPLSGDVPARISDRCLVALDVELHTRLVALPWAVVGDRQEGATPRIEV